MNIKTTAEPVSVVVPAGLQRPDMPTIRAFNARQGDVKLIKGFVGFLRAQTMQLDGPILQDSESAEVEQAICEYLNIDYTALVAERAAAAVYLLQVHRATHGDVSAPGQPFVGGGS